MKVTVNRKEYHVNNSYQYEDEDLLKLNNRAAQAGTKWADPMRDDELEGRLQGFTKGAFPGKLLVQINKGGSHWVGVMVEQKDATSPFTATYSDSLNSSAAMPVNLRGVFTRVLGSNIRFDTYAASFTQADSNSCGVMMYENLKRMAQGDVSRGNPTAESLRAKHIELLGGDFARKQQENRAIIPSAKLHRTALNEEELKQVHHVVSLVQAIENDTIKSSVIKAFSARPAEEKDLLIGVRDALQIASGIAASNNSQVDQKNMAGIIAALTGNSAVYKEVGKITQQIETDRELAIKLQNEEIDAYKKSNNIPQAASSNEILQKEYAKYTTANRKDLGHLSPYGSSAQSHTNGRTR